MEFLVKGGMNLEDTGFDKFYTMTCCALKSIQKLKNRYMATYGLTSAHTMCLRQLNDAPEGLTRTRLAKLCDIDKAQVSRIVNDLCSKGYMTEPDSENINYRKRLKLTPLGKDTAKHMNEIISEIHSFVSKDISPQQLTSFYDTLDFICNRLKQAEDTL